MVKTSEKARIRVGMISLGCPKTLVDSELILGKLDPQKYALADSVTHCDIALVNTCAFIKEAQEESIDHILSLIELKREGKIGRLMVLGCLPQRFPKELGSEFREVDAFVGSGEYGKLPQLLDSLLRGDRPVEVGVPGYLYSGTERRVSLTPLYSRYLKISEGCDHTCSFCVIPLFRGRHRSRKLEDVVSEARKLADEGAKEIVLTGQDTTFFGYDLEGKFLLSKLLEELNKITEIRWIRLLYAYPSLVNEGLIESIAGLEKVCHYLDIPLQHISDRILRSMRRGIGSVSTRKLIERLRNRISDLAIRTTFIVGYPGESEGEFDELLEFMKEAKFERLGVLAYSAETGSPASEFTGQVSEEVKAERLKRAMLVQQSISHENNRKWIGKTIEVLLEGPSEETPSQWLGRTYMDAPEVDGTVNVRVAEKEIVDPGAFRYVKIVEVQQYDLVGKLTKGQKA